MPGFYEEHICKRRFGTEPVDKERSYRRVSYGAHSPKAELYIKRDVAGWRLVTGNGEFLLFSLYYCPFCGAALNSEE